MTDYLLIGIIVLLCIRIVQAQVQRNTLIEWLDALGDMLGDMLRELINKEKEKHD